MDSLPLEGLRVLDLSRLLPGPYCTRILSDFGAEVIRIEPPEGGDWLRDAGSMDGGMQWLFQALNTGKKSLKLNLKSQEGKQIFLQMVERADVLFETFRPEVMDRLGLGYEELSKVNPRLVYCSLTGYGAEGPYRERVGHDLNYIGLTGLLDLTGNRDGPPVIPATQVADIMGALWAAIGILLALQQRGRTGEGMRVEGTLLGAALSSLPVAISRQLGGRPMKRGDGDLSGELVCYNLYETKDGQYMSLGALEPKFWRNFCKMVGKEHLIGEQFAQAASGESVYDELCELFQARTRQEWVMFFEGEEVCCEPVYSLEEGLSCDPVQSLAMLMDDSLLPPLKLPRQWSQSFQPAPELGQHTHDLLHELDYSSEDIERFRTGGVI